MWRTAAALGLAVGITGCAGARYDVRADHAKYPVSMSPALKDESGKTVFLNHGLESKGDFTLSKTKLGFFYSAISLDEDLSEELNHEVEARQGEGITKFSLQHEECALNFFFPLTILPFWPGCESLEVKGTVVARQPGAPPPPPAAPPLEKSAEVSR